MTSAGFWDGQTRAYCRHLALAPDPACNGSECTRCGQKFQNFIPAARTASSEVEAPADVTATELCEVTQEAIARAGGPPTRVVPGFLLGFLATCVSVMRSRGWTVLPPGAHRPIDPR